ncbi:MAG: chromosome segregation protein SMC [Candidatus Hydrogenedentota bacterium]
MYFKRLELTGFKSFAERTLVELEPGITAIVGPNGCGKSNILDALRWALGEQSAKELRGGNMHDVIFNGSETRSPMGMSEVSAVFDNANGQLPVDFAEVEITRRVYRSGESEYLINKAPCRLKDIQEMLMDTGISTQAYSMVGQGKMDMIISSKPEDRRALFEEAAGVIKYKNRKRVAMRKLDSAEQNLLRLHDIIAEVQRQMRSLKRQVNAAIRYKELSAQLRDLEIRAAWLRFKQLTAGIRQMQADYTVASDVYERIGGEIERLEHEHEALGLKRLESDRAVSARRDEVQGVDSEIEKLEREIALQRQQLDFSGEQIDQAHTERENLLTRSSNALAEAEAAEARAENAAQEVEQAAAEVEAKQAEYARIEEQVQEAEQQYEAMRADAVASMNDRNRVQTEAETLRTNLDHVDKQVAAIDEQRRNEDARREDLVRQMQQAENRQHEQQEALARLEADREQLTAEQEAAAAELRKVDENWQNLREKKSSQEARLNSLRELRDSYEGFAAGVRAVMQAHGKGKGGLDGVIGPVGDLLSTQKKFEQAVEAALGGSINNVVVDNADSAKAAVNYLKNNRAGRVTFLPLDIIRGGIRDESRALEGQKGVIGLAINVVEYDSRIRNAVEYLLQSTVIVETLDDTIRIAREMRRYPRLVTLEGEVVTSAGAVTGGRTRHESRGLLGRSAEIAELEDYVAGAENELNAFQKRRAQLAETIQQQRDRIATLQQEESATRKALNDTGVKIAQLSTELDNLKQSANTLEQQRHTLLERRAELAQKLETALAEVSNLDSTDEALQTRIAEAQEAANQARQTLAACGKALSDLRVRHAELTQRCEEARREAQRLRQERDNAVAEAEKRQNTAGDLQERQGELQEAIEANQQRLQELQATREAARQRAQEAEGARRQLLDETDALEKRLRALREVSREAQARAHSLEMTLAKDEDRVTYFEQRIRDEYELELQTLSAEDVGTDEYDDATREEQVADLRNKLHRMGDVNLTAIEEYDTLEKRYDFLVSQAQDLEKARETLMSVVARSDKMIREMFLETFRSVAENFRVYFRQLFSGGQARIYLMNEDDPLDSGIEIEARPPGKKPQSISVLSGGEKALTAIALLFSIFKAKPSPFCVLDEVDAPLDDANIGRFLSLLNEFTGQSQFVVITHNKQTMAAAGALYGVTMQERGVSELVSVRFDEAPTAESAA